MNSAHDACWGTNWPPLGYMACGVKLKINMTLALGAHWLAPEHKAYGFRQ